MTLAQTLMRLLTVWACAERSVLSVGVDLHRDADSHLLMEPLSSPSRGAFSVLSFLDRESLNPTGHTHRVGSNVSGAAQRLIVEPPSSINFRHAQ